MRKKKTKEKVKEKRGRRFYVQLVFHGTLFGGLNFQVFWASWHAFPRLRALNVSKIQGVGRGSDTIPHRLHIRSWSGT